MPSRLLIPRTKANVRWVADPDHTDGGSFEMWCPDCDKQFKPGASFWPMTLEFWDPHNLQRCRACQKALNARRIRERRRDDPDFRRRQVEQSRQIRRFQPQRLRTPEDSLVRL